MAPLKHAESSSLPAQCVQRPSQGISFLLHTVNSSWATENDSLATNPTHTGDPAAAVHLNTSTNIITMVSKPHSFLGGHRMNALATDSFLNDVIVLSATDHLRFSGVRPITGKFYGLFVCRQLSKGLGNAKRHVTVPAVVRPPVTRTKDRLNRARD